MLKWLGDILNLRIWTELPRKLLLQRKSKVSSNYRDENFDTNSFNTRQLDWKFSFYQVCEQKLLIILE